jgi:hypothetical protein
LDGYALGKRICNSCEGYSRTVEDVGVLQAQYILMGSTLLEGEPTTVAEDEVF